MKIIYKDYSTLEDDLSKKNLRRILYNTVELCRTELLETPRTTGKAQDTILHWWNTLKVKPDITEHRFSYIILYALRRKAYSKVGE